MPEIHIGMDGVRRLKEMANAAEEMQRTHLSQAEPDCYTHFEEGSEKCKACPDDKPRKGFRGCRWDTRIRVGVEKARAEGFFDEEDILASGVPECLGDYSRHSSDYNCDECPLRDDCEDEGEVRANEEQFMRD